MRMRTKKLLSRSFLFHLLLQHVLFLDFFSSFLSHFHSTSHSSHSPDCCFFAISCCGWEGKPGKATRSIFGCFSKNSAITFAFFSCCCMRTWRVLRREERKESRGEKDKQTEANTKKSKKMQKNNRINRQKHEKSACHKKWKKENKRPLTRQKENYKEKQKKQKSEFFFIEFSPWFLSWPKSSQKGWE